MMVKPRAKRQGGRGGSELEIEQQHGRMSASEAGCRIGYSPCRRWLVVAVTRSRGQRALDLGRDRLRRPDLRHQIVVPFALDLEMRRGAELDGLDKVMRSIGVDAGLAERVE